MKGTRPLDNDEIRRNRQDRLTLTPAIFLSQKEG